MIIKNTDNTDALPYAVLVGIAENKNTASSAERSLDELERLLNTAGALAFAKVIQIKDRLDARTLIGSGKAEEIGALCRGNGVSLVVFDIELSPAQIRNLEDTIGDDVTVIDRSMLILDIFALHAKSGEGKLQVELAQLRYSAPRLIGQGGDLSRQGGGIGSRGPGESKLETDKRHLRERIASLEARLSEIEHNRAVMREKRDRSGVPKIAVVGYTNAGKSTLLNLLTNAGVLAEDKLFATLDATTRKLELPGGENVLITDTVGFIRKLPHHLVSAFRSTLDEVRYADILLLVADITDPEVKEEIAVTEQVIEELGAKDKPRLYVFNKCDGVPDISFTAVKEDTVCISAKENRGVDVLLETLERLIHSMKRETTLLIPYTEQNVLNQLYGSATVKNVEYTDGGISVSAVLGKKELGKFRKYLTDPIPESTEEDFD